MTFNRGFFYSIILNFNTLDINIPLDNKGKFHSIYKSEVRQLISVLFGRINLKGLITFFCLRLVNFAINRN